MTKRRNMSLKNLSLSLGILILLSGCEFIKMKNEQAADNSDRVAVARVNNAYLYKDELAGILTGSTTKQDSTERAETYINGWIRKQLLIQEAGKKININEAEVERKILDYRFSLIAYEYQSYYIKQNLDTAISAADIEKYYTTNIDNFILKQNIVQAVFVKVPKSAPRINRVKDLMFSQKEKDQNELKSYCLSFSTAYHLSDSAWMVFDELVKNSPLAEIPNKIQFLKANRYYETSDDSYLYFLKVAKYRISDNISPLEFVRDDIRNIILNKRKVELAKRLEDEVYNKAVSEKEFEVFK
jgi:hypothetical protein